MRDGSTSRHIDLTDTKGIIDRLVDELQAFADIHHVPATVVQDVHLALDEIVSNVIRHGGADDRVCHVLVDFSLDGDEFRVDIRDNADPFDPLRMPDPDPNLPLPDRPIGGLGIYFVKALMTDVRYSHEDGMNHLALTKRWGDGL